MIKKQKKITKKTRYELKKTKKTVDGKKKEVHLSEFRSIIEGLSPVALKRVFKDRG